MVSSNNNPIPQHIAIIMDGNGRWAKQRFLPRKFGHARGVSALRNCISGCIESGVQVLTVFAFSSENWQRDADEIDALFDLMTSSLAKEVPGFIAKGIELHFVGSSQRLSLEVQQQLRSSEQATAGGQVLRLNICFNYGGRWDIVQAVQKLQQLQQEVSEQAISQMLSLASVADPDLVIRTGGEQRLSNFLLWQAAYAELFFSDKLWPDFDAKELRLALGWYQQRERRFGCIPE